VAEINEMRGAGVRMPEVPVGPEEEYVGLVTRLEELNASLAKEEAKLELQREERTQLEKELMEEGVDLAHPGEEQDRLKREVETHLMETHQRIAKFEDKLKGILSLTTEDEESTAIDLH